MKVFVSFLQRVTVRRSNHSRCVPIAKPRRASGLAQDGRRRAGLSATCSRNGRPSGLPMQAIGLLRAAFAGAMLLCVSNAAVAQQFTGQPVTLIVNYSVGGPTDLEARIIAHHLPRFLKGVPSVIVKNVPGAGGAIGVNQLGEAATKDKLSVGFFTWDPVMQILHSPTLHVRFNDLKFIAGMQQTNLLYIRRDTVPAIVKSADVAKAQRFKTGVLGNGGDWSALRQRLSLELLGAKFDTITGYKGTRDVDMAILQGDIHLVSNSLPGYFSYAKPNLVDKGLVMPLLQYDRADGKPGRSADLPDVPTFLEVYRDVHGANAMPSGEKWEALQMLTRLMEKMTRAIFMPPNAPEAAVAEMRAAFEQLSKDPEFIAQYEKIALTQPRFVIGAEGERIINELGSVPPAMVSFLRRYIDSLQ